MYLCACVYVCVFTRRGQKRALSPLEMECQVIVSCCLTWVIGTELGSPQEQQMLCVLSHLSSPRIPM